MTHKKIMALFLAALLSQGVFTGCSNADTGATISDNSGKESTADASSGSDHSEEESTVSAASDSAHSDTESATAGVATADEMADIVDVVEEGMVPVRASDIENGVYTVTVDSSSSMFKITDCTLAVSDDKMSAVMTMSGTGYLYLYMGTGNEAVAADKADYIIYEETADGTHTFTVPVEALDQGIACAAYSKRKEQWYDRTLLFRSDSLPVEALKNSSFTDPRDLDLKDGIYTAEVTLEGGSGKASVVSPAKITVRDGQVWAEIVWSSNNYDFMEIEGKRYDPVNSEGNSTFEIPVSGFDYKMPVSADTTAMSTPHLINYTLTFDSESISEAEPSA